MQSWQQIYQSGKQNYVKMCLYKLMLMQHPSAGIVHFPTCFFKMLQKSHSACSCYHFLQTPNVVTPTVFTSPIQSGSNTDLEETGGEKSFCHQTGLSCCMSFKYLKDRSLHLTFGGCIAEDLRHTLSYLMQFKHATCSLIINFEQPIKHQSKLSVSDTEKTKGPRTKII